MIKPKELKEKIINLNGRLGKKKLSIIIIGLLIIIGLALRYSQQVKLDKYEPANSGRIYELVRSDNCEQLIGEFKNSTPNPENMEEAKALYSYRGLCYFRNSIYQEALSDFENQKNVCTKLNDKDCIQSAEYWIAVAKKYIANPAPNTSPPRQDSEDLTPEARKAVEGS